jgi:hypothetical protein
VNLLQLQSCRFAFSLERVNLLLFLAQNHRIAGIWSLPSKCTPD